MADEKIKDLDEDELVLAEAEKENTGAIVNEIEDHIDENVEEIAEEATEADEEAEEADEESPTEKKGLFGKKKEKRDKKDIRIEELTDRLQRQMAEFDNFRKRTDKEKAAMYEIGSKSVIEKMLPIIDNFERGLAAVSEDQKSDAFVEGMERVYKQFMDTMGEMEVKVIEAVGQEFDPNLHNAVMHIEDEEAGNNIIIEEFQKGYTYRDNVVRYSMVKVAN